MKHILFATCGLRSQEVLCGLLFIALITIGVAPPCLAEVSQPDTAPTYREAKVLYQAQGFFKKGDFKQCGQVLEDYLQANAQGGHSDLFLLLGNNYFQRQDYAMAEAVYQRGQQSNPQNPLFYRNLALAMEKRGDLSGAGEAMASAYRVQKNTDPQLLYQAASLFIRAEHYHRAEELLKKLIRDHAPAQRSWLELLLYVFYQIENYPQAIPITEQLLAQTPQDRSLWKGLAQLNLQQKHYAEAVAALEVAFQYESPSIAERNQLANLYLYLNLPLRAAATFEGGSEQNSKADLKHLATLYWRGGLLDKADRCLSQIIEQWPEAEAYRDRAQLLYERAEYDKALELLETACKRYPEQAELHLAMGYAAWQVEDWPRAGLSFIKARRFNLTKTNAEAALQIIETLTADVSQRAPIQSIATALPRPLD